MCIHLALLIYIRDLYIRYGMFFLYLICFSHANVKLSGLMCFDCCSAGYDRGVYKTSKSIRSARVSLLCRWWCGPGLFFSVLFFFVVFHSRTVRILRAHTIERILYVFFCLSNHSICEYGDHNSAGQQYNNSNKICLALIGGLVTWSLAELGKWYPGIHCSLWFYFTFIFNNSYFFFIADFWCV